MVDDRILLLRTHRGHEPSARALWERHAPAMLALAGAILQRRGAASAEDVVQIAFCRVLETDRRRLRAVRDVRAWLCQTTRHIALNELRTHRRERDRHRHADTRAGVPAAPTNDDLARSVAALPRKMREVLVLKHAGGLTFDQIALALDVPRTTAASRYQGAIARLRETMQTPSTISEEVAHG